MKSSPSTLLDRLQANMLVPQLNFKLIARFALHRLRIGSANNNLAILVDGDTIASLPPSTIDSAVGF
jgi:hypothetical protein